jgi:hypothetical protein
LKILDAYTGDLPLRRVHHETSQPYARARLAAGRSPGTSNRDFAVVRRILNAVPELQTSVFVVLKSYVKNGLDSYLVLNRIARSVIESCRGQHPERVFSRDGEPVTKLYNSG